MNYYVAHSFYMEYCDCYHVVIKIFQFIYFLLCTADLDEIAKFYDTNTLKWSGKCEAIFLAILAVLLFVASAYFPFLPGLKHDFSCHSICRYKYGSS